MEYDRALFRVYERVMEELIASDTNDINNNTRTYETINTTTTLRRRTTGATATEENVANDEEEEDTTNAREEGQGVTTTTTTTHNNAGYDYKEVLFYFPFINLQRSIQNTINTMSHTMTHNRITESYNNSRRQNVDYEEVDTNDRPSGSAVTNRSSSSSNNNPLYNYHADRIRNRMNINRQSFSIRTITPPSDHDHDLVDDDADQDEEEEDGSSDNNNEEESDEEEMTRTINNTVERIREIRERMSTVRRRQTFSAEEEDALLSNRVSPSFMCTQVGCWKIFQFCFVVSMWHLFVIGCLHYTYITSQSRRIRALPGSSCIDYALRSRRRRRTPSASQNTTQWSGTGNTTAIANNTTTSNEVEEEDLPPLGNEEILQIKILYGGSCNGQCSRVHTIIPPSNRTNTTAANDTIATAKSSWSYNNKIKSDTFSTSEYWAGKANYRFSSSEALLYLEDDLLYKYNISLVNVTLTERCLTTGSDHGSYTSIWIRIAEFLSPIYDMDTPIVNLLCLGLSSPPKEEGGESSYGYLQNVRTTQHWSWKSHKTPTATPNHTSSFSIIITSCIAWFLHKLSALLLSILAFFLITSVTSLVVRVLTSSGVVLMYPLFSLFQYLQIPHADERILSLSYPWIGRARQAIRQSSIHPTSHFLYAHTCKILLFYIMYEACQAAWSMVLYGRNVSESIPIWIYGIVMIWEYFTMVFLRSATSTYFFPRYILILFVGYHLYFFGSSISPYPYASIALIPLFLLSVQGMIYVLLVCEIPTVQRGSISFECPREVFTRISWPDWTASLPQDFTLFLPLNSRYRSLYDVDVLTQPSPQEVDAVQSPLPPLLPRDAQSSSSSSSSTSSYTNEHSHTNNSTTTHNPTTIVVDSSFATNHNSSRIIDALVTNWDNNANLNNQTTSERNSIHTFLGIV